MKKRLRTDVVIFHHALAVTATKQDIVRWHTAPKRYGGRGWEAPGYHYYVRKNGVVYEMRGIRWQGAHAFGRNGKSIGVCLEGNFHKEEPTLAQLEACQGVYHQLCRQYNKSLKVEFHRYRWVWNACPGKRLDRTDFLEIVKRGDPYSEENSQV